MTKLQKCMMLLLVLLLGLIPVGCRNATYTQRDYEKYINANTDYLGKFKDFGYTDSLSLRNKDGEMARNYYFANRRRAGDFEITDYKDGICINRAYGKEEIVIPETIDDKPVIKIGGYVNGDPNGEDEFYFGAFNNCRHFTLELPSTVKEIAGEAIPLGIIENSPPVARLTKITVSPDNPYYKVVNYSLYSKDMKWIFSMSDDDKGYFEVPESVEYVAIGNADDTCKTIYIGKNVKKIYYLCYDQDYEAEENTFTVQGYKGTAAEKWAKENGLTFVLLD